MIGKDRMLRIDEACRIYQKIKIWYGTFICSKDGKECIVAFDTAMPSYKDKLTAVKKIDYLLWSKEIKESLTMEYTLIEQRTLDTMKRTDFKNLSKNDVLSIAFKLGELRPDVAKEVIAQFPELAKLIQPCIVVVRNRKFVNI